MCPVGSDCDYDSHYKSCIATTTPGDSDSTTLPHMVSWLREWVRPESVRLSVISATNEFGSSVKFRQIPPPSTHTHTPQTSLQFIYAQK